MRKPRFSPQAASDLEDIAHHLAAAAGSERALQVLDRLETMCDLLARYPTLGRSRAELARYLRSFAVWPYVILYRSRRGTIEVARIIHGARDLPALF